MPGDPRRTGLESGQRPAIYHITHVANLAGIVTRGLLCDRKILAFESPVQIIGMSSIKTRRLEKLEVKCHPGTKVGDYVPFNFCPRSVMLYVIHRGNHAELKYRGGQDQIVHLEADLQEVVRWADADHRRWAFSLSNAGASYAEFRSRVEELDELDWAAINATDFRDAAVKEHKQAEFLVHEWLPFDLVRRIGVRSGPIKRQAAAAIEGAEHHPVIEVLPHWYF
jgi:hypothetical protein